MPASVAARVWYWRRTFAEALDGSGMRRQPRGENNTTNVAEANQTQHNTSQQRQTRNQQRRSRGSFRANCVSGRAMRCGTHNKRVLRYGTNSAYFVPDPNGFLARNHDLAHHCVLCASIVKTAFSSCCIVCKTPSLLLSRPDCVISSF